MEKRIGLIVLSVITSLVFLVLIFSSTYVVDEGRVAVITNMGKAIRQESPSGLKFKLPIVTGVREFDVRERALTGTLGASTSNQLATTVDFSVNWNPDPSQIMNIFVNYGSPDDFAINTLRPRLQQSLKATIGKFTGADLTQRRDDVASAMLAEAQRVLSTYPVILSSVQLENFTLPERYMEAVLQKEEQREATQREELALQQQSISSRREVQSAEAERDATTARADGEAYALVKLAEAEAQATRIKAEAEADGIEAIRSAIANDPTYIDWTKASRWDGQLPQTVLGNSPDILMSLENVQ